MVGDSLVGLDRRQRRRNGSDSGTAMLCCPMQSKLQSIAVWSYSMQEEVAGPACPCAPDSPFILHQIVLHRLCIVYFEIYFNLMLPT